MAKAVYPRWSDGTQTFCGKIPHRDQAAAREAMVTANARLGPKRDLKVGKTGHQTEVYWCRSCGAYHWGHVD